MPNGKIKWFNEKKGFGFIKPDDEDKDIFVHISAFEKAGIEYLNEGEALSYEVASEKGRKKAVNLKKIQFINNFFLYYLSNKINIAVRTNSSAINHSITILIFVFFKNFLIPVPNIAQQEIHGKLITEDKITRNNKPIIRFSSLGKNKETAVMQITQALGFTN